MTPTKKKPQIHHSRIDRTGTKWTVTEQQREAVLASLKILGGIPVANKKKGKNK